MRATLEQAGEHERGRPDDDDDNPDHEKAAEHDTSKEVPVEEADGQLDQTESGDANEEVGQFELDNYVMRQHQSSREAADRGTGSYMFRQVQPPGNRARVLDCRAEGIPKRLLGDSYLGSELGYSQLCLVA